MSIATGPVAAVAGEKQNHEMWRTQRCIGSAFTAQVRHMGERIALISDTRTLSYRQLEIDATLLAHLLIARGVTPGAIVGLLAPRSAEAIIAMLAVVKAGASYLPIDPAISNAQLCDLCADAQPALLLVHPDLSHRNAGLVCNIAALELGKAMALPTSIHPLPQVTHDDAAYVMYTSGSTGKPKGVVIPHRGVLRLVLGADYARLDSRETLLQLAPLGFDASTFEIWGALLNGGKLAIVGDAQPSLERIAEMIERHGVTTMWLTAGLFHLMAEHRPQAFARVHQLLAGGDVLSPVLVEKLRREAPFCRVINGYGPTENTTFTTCYPLPDEGCRGAIPIGKPISGCEVYVLDDQQQPVTEGETGELYAGGAGVGLGYLRRPELTAERFLPNPWRAGELMYRTGDRVRRDADGTLHFLGRTDRQVKINGKRVELDGIEGMLRRHPGVREAAAMAYGDDAANRRIVAFVAADGVTAQYLRDFLHSELPDYMLPQVLEVMAALPLTRNGKLDRPALTARLPKQAPAPAAVTKATRGGGTEAALLDLCTQVFGKGDIGVDQNFFDAGATSLQLMKLHAAIQASLSPRVTLVDLFTYPRVSALAQRIGPVAVPAQQAAH